MGMELMEICRTPKGGWSAIHISPRNVGRKAAHMQEDQLGKHGQRQASVTVLAFFCRLLQGGAKTGCNYRSEVTLLQRRSPRLWMTGKVAGSVTRMHRGFCHVLLWWSKTEEPSWLGVEEMSE